MKKRIFIVFIVHSVWNRRSKRIRVHEFYKTDREETEHGTKRTLYQMNHDKFNWLWEIMKKTQKFRKWLWNRFIIEISNQISASISRFIFLTYSFSKSGFNYSSKFFKFIRRFDFHFKNCHWQQDLRTAILCVCRRNPVI